jgi:hypothetical protein
MNIYTDDNNNNSKKMYSLDGVFTLQPEEIFEKSTLERVNELSDAEATALLPAIHTILNEEVAAWADHCAIAQSMSYNTIVTRLHEPGADVEAIKAMATYHKLETVPARFAVLVSKSCGKLREPLSKILNILHRQVQRYATINSVGIFLDTQRRSVYSHGFAKAMSELEATMTGLENSRMEQLRQVHKVLFEERRVQFTSTKHVVAFLVVIEEMGIYFDSIWLD